MLVTQVTADPYDLNVLYATSQNGLARSRDNGVTWDFPVLVGGLARNSWAVAVHPVNSGIIYTGDGANVWRSADYGDTWTQSILTSSGGVFQMALDPNDPKIVYATIATMSGDTTNDGLYGTIDDGEHWSRVGLAGRQVNAVQAVKDTTGTTVYAGVGDMWSGSTTGGVFRKRAGETDWTQVGPQEAVVVDMAVDPRNRRHIYIGVGSSSPPYNKPPYGVLESQDGGDTWTQVLTTPMKNIWTLAIDPQNPDVLYAGTMDTIYRSRDGGATWDVYYQGGEGANIQSLFIPSPPPTPVTSFTAKAKDSATNQLSWTNPLDVGFTGTMIRYRTDKYPENCGDGVLLATQAASPGSSDTADHSGVSGSETYYYSVFANDYAGRFSAASKASLGPVSGKATALRQSAPASVFSSQTSLLYLSTATGLYRRSVGGFQIYLPLLFKVAP